MTDECLAPEISAFFDQRVALGLPQISRLNPPEARAAATMGQEIGTRRLSSPVPYRDVEMGLPGRRLGARLFTPRAHPDGGQAPVLIWYHGGGFVVGDLDSTNQVCSRLALKAEVAVLSVDYRLAPEHAWPAAHLDAAEALLWVLREGAGYGLDTSRIAVGGDSAGATLAASAAKLSGREGLGVAAQILFYPVIGASMDSPSYERFAEGYGLSAREMEWFLGHYGVLDSERAAEFDRVLADPDPSLPPMLLLSAECDPLRDEAERYARAAMAAGAEVTAIRYLGVPHGFMQMTAVTGKAEMALREVARFMRERLKNPATDTRSPAVAQRTPVSLGYLLGG